MGSLPMKCQIELKEAIDLTLTNTGLTLILALSYSAKWELVEAIKKIAKAVQSDLLKVEAINDELISAHLSTASFPDPELMIRTSGEHRISNFLLYQLAYAELYFTSTHWPDFRKEQFIQAICDYQNRERRFGKVSEQIKQPNE